MTGRHKYISDMKLPGMQYGKVLRPESFGATLASVSMLARRKRCRASPSFATEISWASPRRITQTAASALKAIKVEWKPPTQQPDSKNIYDYLKANVQNRRRGGGERRSRARTDNCSRSMLLSPPPNIGSTQHIKLRSSRTRRWNRALPSRSGKAIS